jgi:hypothetical protein
MTRAERLAEFYQRLHQRPPAKSAQEALERVRITLTEVEDDYSGIPQSIPPPVPDQSDGRMYPPMSDYVTINIDGSILAQTRQHDIVIGGDGSITIKNRANDRIEFHQGGEGV